MDSAWLARHVLDRGLIEPGFIHQVRGGERRRRREEEGVEASTLEQGGKHREK